MSFTLPKALKLLLGIKLQKAKKRQIEASSNHQKSKMSVHISLKTI